MSTYRIAMMFDAARGWTVTGCYEGKGPVPMVRTYRDGSKELILSYHLGTYPVGTPIDPLRMLTAWQRRPIRKRRIAESRAARSATSVRPATFEPFQVTV